MRSEVVWCWWCENVKKGKSLKEIREEYPKAYAPWSEYEELQLLKLHKDGNSYSEIAEVLERKRGAVTSRLKKLGVIGDGE